MKDMKNFRDLGLVPPSALPLNCGYNLFNPASQYAQESPLGPCQTCSQDNPFNPANRYHPAYSINQAVRQKKRSMIAGRAGTDVVGSTGGTYSRAGSARERRALEAILFILLRRFLG